MRSCRTTRITIAAALAMALVACGDSGTSPDAPDDLALGESHVAVSGQVTINRTFQGEMFLYEGPSGGGDGGIRLVVGPVGGPGGVAPMGDSVFVLSMRQGRGELTVGSHLLETFAHMDFFGPGGVPEATTDHLFWAHGVYTDQPDVYLHNSGTRLVIDELDLPGPGGTGGVAVGRIVLDLSGYRITFSGTSETVAPMGGGMTGTISFRIPVRRLPG